MNLYNSRGCNELVHLVAEPTCSDTLLPCVRHERSGGGKWRAVSGERGLNYKGAKVGKRHEC